ncbi:hypothetical protein Peur_008685 [Populus x canadensis]
MQRAEMQRRLQSCSPSTVAKKMGPSLSLRDTPSCCLLGFSRVAPAEETPSLTSPRGSNVSQYQCTRSKRFVWAGWRSRHETLCDDHDDLNLNRASDLFESLLACTSNGSVSSRATRSKLGGDKGKHIK